MPYVKQSTATFGATVLEAKPMNQTTDPISVTMRQPYRTISALKRTPDTQIRSQINSTSCLNHPVYKSPSLVHKI